MVRVVKYSIVLSSYHLLLHHLLLLHPVPMSVNDDRCRRLETLGNAAGASAEGGRGHEVVVVSTLQLLGSGKHLLLLLWLKATAAHCGTWLLH